MKETLSSCNGKCGQGKRVGSSYFCPHYNLAVLYPDLCKEWDPENIQSPETYLPGTSKKAKWICSLNPCGCHKWESNISTRTKMNCGCPYCSNQKVCIHKNLTTARPDLKVEWDYMLNLDKPEEYAPSAGKKKHWICSKNNLHKWETTIDNRVSKGSGCPYCCGGKPDAENNLLVTHSELCKEWDYEKNGKLLPENCASHAHTKVWWRCNKSKCDCHVWKAAISGRTRKGREVKGCPYCASKKLCNHNNLAVLRPDLCDEWDYNKNSKSPENYSPGSNVKVWWICSKNPSCDCHNWEAVISSRASNIRKLGCPYCDNQKLCNHNNFEALYPDLCKEWDYDKNKKLPSTYPRGSDQKVWWKCKQGHSWESVIHSRTHDKCPTGCPQCSNSKGYSSMQILWLTNLAKKYDIQIQHAESIEGERNISTPTKSYKVDGYCTIKDKLIVFEFDGCFWHGCNVCYEDQTFVNTRCKKSMQELRSKTQHKHQAIRDAGYTLIVMKECDYNSSQVFCKELEDILY